MGESPSIVLLKLLDTSRPEPCAVTISLFKLHRGDECRDISGEIVMRNSFTAIDSSNLISFQFVASWLLEFKYVKKLRCT